MRLHLNLDLTGTASVQGVIRRQEGSTRQVLVAANTTADAACADRDDDGLAGVSRLAADFRDSRTGRPVPVVLTPTAHDFDASGVYEINLRIGDETLTGDVRAHVRLPWLTDRR